MRVVEALYRKIPNNTFRDTELNGILPELTPKGRLSALSRALKTKELIRLRRGLYLFGDRWRRKLVSPFVIANQLYQPSVVSLESALSYYRLIPEAAYTVTSVINVRRNKNYQNSVGVFSFQYVPLKPFFMWAEKLQDITHSGALVAHPLRALFDFFYVHRKSIHSLNELEQDLRIDLGVLRELVISVAVKDLEVLAKSYKRRSIQKLFQLLVSEFK